MQLTLDFTGGLTTRFRSLKQACAHAVYHSRVGLTGVAIALDMSPSELSKRLAEDESPDNRPLRDRDIVGIIAETSDRTPVYWLIERFLSDPKAKQAAALAELAAMAPVLTALAEQAGVVLSKPRKGS